MDESGPDKNSDNAMPSEHRPLGHETNRTIYISWGLGFVMVALAALLAIYKNPLWLIIATALIGAALILHGSLPRRFTKKRLSVFLLCVAVAWGLFLSGMEVAKQTNTETTKKEPPRPAPSIPLGNQPTMPGPSPSPDNTPQAVKNTKPPSSRHALVSKGEPKADVPPTVISTPITSPAPSPTVPSQLVQNAPQGINVGPGAFVSNPIVNNFGPIPPQFVISGGDSVALSEDEEAKHKGAHFKTTVTIGSDREAKAEFTLIFSSPFIDTPVVSANFAVVGASNLRTGTVLRRGSQEKFYECKITLIDPGMFAANGKISATIYSVEKSTLVAATIP
jgi:hypothetical protein